MRQGKLSELIHNSAKHPNCQACTVEIHFHEIIDGEGINDYQIVPGSQLVVARQASRNNASKYFINDKASNFTEVTSLLKARGIDLDHKRFLILQGEVESIALMKPKAKDNNDDGLLEYLEDIIGTSKYKTPIEEASVRLEALNEVRGEKVGRVKYVSREMEGMEEKKAEAENYLENENELAQRKNELYQIYLYETRQNVDVATRAIEELNTKMSEEVKKCEAIEQEKLALNDTYQQTVDAYNEIEKESEKIAKRQAKLEREDVQLREKKEHMVNKQEKGKATLESDREARLAAQEAIKKNTEELNDRKEEVTELEKQLKLEEAKLEEVSKELKGKTDSYLAQIEQHQKELAPWTEKINEKQKTIDVKRSEIEILTEQIMSGKKAVEEAEEQATKIKKMTRDKKKELEALPNNIKEVNIEIKELESYLLEFAQSLLQFLLVVSGQRALALLVSYMKWLMCLYFTLVIFQPTLILRYDCSLLQAVSPNFSNPSVVFQMILPNEADDLSFSSSLILLLFFLLKHLYIFSQARLVHFQEQLLFLHLHLLL